MTGKAPLVSRPSTEGSTTDHGRAVQWLEAAAHWERSAQDLVLAYRALERRIQDLDLALQARNRALEASLQEREKLQELLVCILDGLPVGVLVWDLNRAIVRVNRAAATFLGRAKLDAGQSVRESLVGSVPEGVVDQIVETVGRGGSCKVDHCVSVPEAPGKRWIRFHGVALTDGKARQLGGLVTLEDLTEVKAMEEEVARRQRLAAMGEMAASIAHEVRNPLGSVQLFASLMSEEDSPEKRRRMMAQVRGAISSVDRLLSNLLTFARPLRPRKQRLNPLALLQECLDFVEPLARQKGIELRLASRGPAVFVSVDPELLKQAVLNILLNSFQAMPSGGTVRAWVATGHAERCGEKRMEGFVEIKLEDTGVGIPPEVLPRVFDPFFTTRPEGSGLGLSLVHNILGSHGGCVWIESEQGRGTTVRMRIPTRSDEEIQE